MYLVRTRRKVKKTRKNYFIDSLISLYLVLIAFFIILTNNNIYPVRTETELNIKCDKFVLYLAKIFDIKTQEIIAQDNYYLIFKEESFNLSNLLRYNIDFEIEIYAPQNMYDAIHHSYRKFGNEFIKFGFSNNNSYIFYISNKFKCK